MPWLAAAALCAVYLYHLPLTLAVVVSARGVEFGVGVFEPRFARRGARRVKVKKKWKKKPSPRMLALGIRILKSMKLTHLDVSVTIGTGDAALTAQACGLLVLCAQAVRAATGARGGVRVTPDFGKAVFAGEACGIVRLTAGHIMKAAAQTILRGAGG